MLSVASAIDPMARPDHQPMTPHVAGVLDGEVRGGRTLERAGLLALEVVGDRWSLLIVRDLMFATAVFPDGVERLTGFTLLGMIVAFSPLVILLGSNFVMKNPTSGGASALYWLIVALIGASMGTVVLLYTGTSVVQTFLITAAAFGALSLFGYTTKKDLTGIGSFLIMGVIGLIIASVVNIFLQNTMMQMIISIAGVLIFAGLTAYDTQRLKNEYNYLRGTEFAGKAVILGALSLYLDFINMFQFLLSFLGNRE